MKKQIKLLSMAVLLASAGYGAELDQTERCAQMIRAAKEEATRTAAKTKEGREAEYIAKVQTAAHPTIKLNVTYFDDMSGPQLRRVVIGYKQVLFSIDDRTAELDAEVGILGKHVQQLGGELVDAAKVAAEALALKEAANARLAQENAEKDARIAALLAELAVEKRVNEENARSQVLIERLIFASKDGRSRVPSAAPVRKIRDETSAAPSLEVVQEASK